MSGMRPWAKTLLGFLTLGAILVGGFVIVIETTSGTIPTSPSGVVVGDVDGRHIAVVAYETDTFSHLDLVRVESMGFSTQAEAFDLDTGDRIWDTMLLAEFGGIAARPLGMGTKYVYISSPRGLMILDAATGGILVREGEIDGLGDGYIASIDAYAWDAETDSVVLLDASGVVLSIPVDSLEASPALPAVTARWRDVLGVESDSEWPDSPAAPVIDHGYTVSLSSNDEDQGLLIVETADGIRSSVIGERRFLGW